MISLQIGRSLYSWIPQQYPSIPDWDVQTIDTILTMKNGIPYQALLYVEIPVFSLWNHIIKNVVEWVLQYLFLALHVDDTHKS